MKALTAARMREVDRQTTDRYGIPSLSLMENAGIGVADAVSARHSDLGRCRVLVLCGKGNNGGDGFVAARHLAARGAQLSVHLFGEPSSLSGDAAANYERWKQVGATEIVRTAADLERLRPELGVCDVVIDALLGTGLAGPAKGLAAQAIEEVNRQATKADVIAVDIPSGMASDSFESAGETIEADATVTFTAPKVGQLLPPNAERVGRLIVREIGSPRELFENDETLKLHWLEHREFGGLKLERAPNSHKGTYGHTLIFAGSRGKSGAAALAGMGALRSGAGLVTIATPAPVQALVAVATPELMTEPLEATMEGTIAASVFTSGRWKELLEGKTAVALGPGLTTEAETARFVKSMVAECPLPLILDADGLNAFAGSAEALEKRKGPLAITPHPGEMARLVGASAREVQGRRLDVALEAARSWNCMVILKGFRTIVTTPEGRAYVNSTGNPGMATGGTGDVLTGILAGLSAWFGTERWETVLALGVYIHGLAGDIAADCEGEISLIATDLLAALPRAFGQLMAERRHG